MVAQTHMEQKASGETGNGANDQHLSVLAFDAPTDHPHGNEHGAHKSQQNLPEVSDARALQRPEVEEHQVQDVEDHHAQRQSDAGEGIGDVSVQERRCHGAPKTYDLQPEVEQRRHLDDRREWCWPLHSECVHHNDHLEDGYELAANDGHEDEGGRPHVRALARDEAPEY